MVADTLGQLPALNTRLNEPSVVSVRQECRWCNLCLNASGSEMKVGFFLLKFPLSSETSSLTKLPRLLIWDLRWRFSRAKRRHPEHPRGMDEIQPCRQTRWLQDEPTGKVAKLRHRAIRPYAAFIVKIPGRRLTSNAWCRVAEPDFVCHLRPGRNTVHADVFIAHFGPAGVTAAKLPNWVSFAAKLPLSSTVLISPSGSAQPLHSRISTTVSPWRPMLPISNLWAGRLQKMGCPREKSPYRAWAWT